MPETTCRILFSVLTAIPFVLLAGLERGKSTASAQHRGWNQTLKLSNGAVEVVVVPAVGRVMQFRFVGEDDIFWENARLAGQRADPKSEEWLNFGGDKVWPSPQSDWPKLTGRGWPPPAGFDPAPYDGRLKEDEIELTAPVDPQYGIRVRRRISLDPKQPALKITTVFEKISGDPLKVSIAVITQVRDFQRAYVLLPEKSRLPQGYRHLGFEVPQDLKMNGRLLSLTRARDFKGQIGSDGGTMLWVGDKHILRIEAPLVAGAEYPNEGCSTVIYTNDNSEPYAELETFSPLRTLKAGEELEQTNTYTLSRRTGNDPDTEARMALGLR